MINTIKLKQIMLRRILKNKLYIIKIGVLNVQRFKKSLE